MIVNLKVDGIVVKNMFSIYSNENALTYKVSPNRTSDYTLVTGTYKYVPTVNFTFNMINWEQFREVFPLLNKPEFILEYLDIELGIVVVRKMYMSESSIKSLHTKGRDLKAILGLTLTAVSYYGYDSYEHLIETATYDERWEDD